MSYEFSFNEPTDHERREYILDMLKQLSELANQCGEDALSTTLDRLVSEHDSSAAGYANARSVRGTA